MPIVRTDLLNVSPVRNIEGAMHIPFEELPSRVAELPKKGSAIRVAEGAEANSAISWLNENGWVATIAATLTQEKVGEVALWSPNELIAQFVERTPCQWLDLACGSGRDATYAASFGHDVTAIDALPDAIKIADNIANHYSVRPSFVVGGANWAAENLASAADIVTMMFYYDEVTVQTLGANMKPGNLLLLESFSTEHREKFGKPNARRCVDPDRNWAPFTVLSLDASWRQERHTCQIVLQR